MKIILIGNMKAAYKNASKGLKGLLKHYFVPENGLPLMLAKTLVVAEILPDFEPETAFLMLKMKGKEAHRQHFKAHCPLFRAIRADFRKNFTVEDVLIPFFSFGSGKWEQILSSQNF